MHLRSRASLVVALLVSLGCRPGAADRSATEAPPPRPGEDQMKEAMMKGLQKKGAARVKGMPSAPKP